MQIRQGIRTEAIWRAWTSTLLNKMLYVVFSGAIMSISIPTPSPLIRGTEIYTTKILESAT